MSGSSNKQQIPWEPYKAACNPNKNFDYSSYNSLNFNLKNSQLTESYQFDEADLQLVSSSSSPTIKPSNKSHSSFPELAKADLVEFKDARFYTDFYFMKMAQDLKSKCMDQPGQKPVNVVTPLSEKKEQTAVSPKPANRYEARIDFLEEQIKGFYEQLQIQTQVNVELKKLLVASIGDSDTAYKIERLINDKQRYEYELISLRKDLEKMNESVEQISIRCDMWRSKFLACKLMNEEASTWKAFLLMLNNQNEKVLKNLLSDNEMLNDKLNQALDLLSEIKESTNVDELLHKNSNKNKSYNNLQATNLLLVGLSAVCKKFNKPTYSAAHTSRLKTSNEAIAHQMSEQFNWVSMTQANTDDSISSFEKLEQLIDKIKFSKATIHSRLYQTTECSRDTNSLLNVCTRCKGQIKIV